MIKPDDDYYDHPVFNPQRLHLETPAMKKLGEEIHRFLWTGATGALITGKSRAGKTRALLALASQLYTRSKLPIPVYYVPIPGRDKCTILHVFRQLCYSLGLRVSNHDRADHLSDRIVHYMTDKAVESNCQSAVLIVDEMQRLWPEQFNAFAELYDKLLLLDIVMTVIFVGNDEECEHLFEKIVQPEYAHIRGRFFTQSIPFHGLKSKAQVKGCLYQYDTLRYPVDGPSYTGYFLRDDVNNGWQLESLSSEIWCVFRHYQRNYKIDSWGMQYFTATINTLLIDFLPRYGVEHFDDDMIHECIRISGLVPSLVSSIA